MSCAVYSGNEDAVWRRYVTRAPGELACALLDAMRRQGIEPLEPIAAALSGGSLVRFRAKGDKPGRRNGWAVLGSNGFIFGHWRLGVRRFFNAATRGPVTRAEQARWEGKLAAVQALRARERREGERDGAEAAAALWRGAGPAGADHPYLAAKRMRPEGLRVGGLALLIPMRDLRTGELLNVQRIAPDGSKRFQSGARVKGLGWGRGCPSGTIALLEGVATAAAVHAATGLCAMAAMSKAGLTGAALTIRRRWPDARLIVGADHDENGGGVKAAWEAAHLSGGLMALPPFPCGWNGLAWDYADLWTSPGGSAAIRAAFGVGGAA